MHALLLTTALGLMATPAFATTWAIDPGHAAAAFKINHLKFSNVFGLIPGLEGTINLDDAAPEKSTFDIHVPIANLTTGNVKRDQDLLGPDFFNAKVFVNVQLRSKSVKKKGADLDVTADLTMHGVTKPISFVFKRGKTGKDPWGNERTGGETSFRVKRTDFGVSHMSKPGEIGDEVEMAVTLEAVKK